MICPFCLGAMRRITNPDGWWCDVCCDGMEGSQEDADANKEPATIREPD